MSRNDLEPALIIEEATEEEKAEARRNREKWKLQHAANMAALEMRKRAQERWW